MNELLEVRNRIVKACKNIDLNCYHVDFIQSDIDNVYYIEIRAKFIGGDERG